MKKFREEEDAVAIPDAVDVPRQQKQQEEEGRSSQGQPQILLHLIPSHLSHVKTLRVPSGGIWRHLEASGGSQPIAARISLSGMSSMIEFNIQSFLFFMCSLKGACYRMCSRFDSV